MLVLIAGITGDLGQRLASAAFSRGLSVRGLGRNPSKLHPDIYGKLESFVTSKNHYDIDALDRSVNGVDGIICAYNMDPVLTLEGGTLLLRAAERAGVKVFIAPTWNNDWSKINYGDFGHYDTHIAFQNYVACNCSIKPIYIFTGYFADLFLTNFGPGYLTVDKDAKKASLRYWGDGNATKISWSSRDDVAAYTIEIFINGEGVQEGKGGFFRFRSGEISIEEFAENYRRVSGCETEVKRMGDVADLERDLANLRLKHGRTGYFASTQESLIKYLTEWGGKEKCRLIKEGDHVQFGYDIRKITYGRRKDATDYSAKKKVYADFRSALEHQESVIINNDLFGKDPNPGVAKFFTIEYKVAYDHFNTELESDPGTYKRRAVYEGGRVGFLWEILHVEYCLT
ncbi:hypothetical protein ACHAPO_010195 [Fusarium lateritium]